MHRSSNARLLWVLQRACLVGVSYKARSAAAGLLLQSNTCRHSQTLALSNSTTATHELKPAAVLAVRAVVIHFLAGQLRLTIASLPPAVGELGPVEYRHAAQVGWQQ